MNSFKAIVRAIEYERERQIEVLEDGGQLFQETRRWDDDKGISYGMRSKENLQDYRYFPDPDLPPLHIDDTWLAEIKADFPELAYQKRERYVRDFGISEAAAAVLTVHKNISDLFEAAAEKSQTAGAANAYGETANLVTGEIMRLMNLKNMQPEDLTGEQKFCLLAKKLSSLICLVTSGKINRSAYKETVEAVFLNDTDPEKYISEKGLMMVSDDNAVIEAVNAVITENESSVADYRSGKEKVFGFLMGQVMKKLGKGGNPELAKSRLEEILKQN